MNCGDDGPSNAMNRVESVGFLEPGTYLVICTVGGISRTGSSYVDVDWK